MKKILFTAATIALLGFGVNALADVKIAVVDWNKVMLNSPQLETAKTDLKKKFDPREKELIAAQKKFQGDVQDFYKNGPTMKAEDKKTAEQKIGEQQKKLQEMQAKFQNDVSSAQNSAMQGIMKKIESIVNKIAAEKQLDVVMAKAATIYSKAELDITDVVVKQIKK